TRRAHLLVDRPLDRFLGRLGRLGLLRFLGDEHLLRRRHHVADRGGLVLGGLAALGQVGGALLLLVLDRSCLDDAKRGLGRLDRSFRGGRLGCFSRGGSGGGRRGLRRLGGLGRCCGSRRRGSRLLRRDLARTRLGRFGGLALRALLLLALAPLRRELFFLGAQLLGLGVLLLLAPAQLFLARLGGNGILGGRRDLVALDEGALLAHLDLDRARLAARVGLLDLARRLARQRDLLALAARGCAVGGTQ